ncbi:hypothetical protein JXO59_09350 [candidate division KSB1 bacterium]|nr:hypothetical protein [candidate division KSB1 bacterium]
MEAIIPISLFIAIVYTFKLYWDYKIRKMAIEKGMTKELQDVLKLTSLPVSDNVPASLKWGLVLTAIGAGGFLGLNMPGYSEEFTLALMILFAGIALVIYYFIASRLSKKQA